MKILCLSTSNVKHKKDDSGSTKTCTLITEIIEEQKIKNTKAKTLALIDFEVKPCIFCGKCAENAMCPYDSEFNNLYKEILQSDVVFVVVPHYSIIPAKLTIILEKLNQFLYTAWIKDPKGKRALAGKKVAIIAHGGGSEKSYSHYSELILKPLNYLFSSLQFKVIGLLDQEPPLGAVFGVTGFDETDSSIFPDMVHDWTVIKKILQPLILNALNEK